MTFQPSETFTGPRPGFIFKNGPQGVGYYPDNCLAAEPSSAIPPWITDAANAASIAVPGHEEPKRPRETRQERVEREQRERRMRLEAQGQRRGGRGSGRGQRDELDPMDPSSYSDAPKGGWSMGLEGSQPRAADTTAGGPLFQQRPYPSPGSVLRANTKMVSGAPNIGPSSA